MERVQCTTCNGLMHTHDSMYVDESNTCYI